MLGVLSDFLAEFGSKTLIAKLAKATQQNAATVR
jgi:putative Ca2+/H+ antiporter (TMEM165/GDT1 family)